MTDLMALDTVAVCLHDGSGHTLSQGVGADGHPLDVLAWELAVLDQLLEEGDWVITGGLTKVCALEVGGGWRGFSIEGAWSAGVEVRRR